MKFLSAIATGLMQSYRNTFYGIDAVVQKYLESKGFSNVTVYCSGVIPRNNFTSSAKIRSCAEAAKGHTSSEFHYVKDIQMANDCDQALMI